MRSPTGRARWTGLLGLLVLGCAAAAPLWQQTFDDQTPGQSPRGWSVGWGNPGDDLLLVSNLRALSGGRSLLLDRLTGEQTPMAGYVTRLPQVAERWCALSCGFLVQGKAEAFSCGLEVRGANPGEHVLAVGLNGRSATCSARGWQVSAALGEFGEDGWYRLRLWLPTKGGGQAEARAQLDRRGTDGGWQGVGPVARVPAKAPSSGYGTLMLVTPPGKRGYFLFLDELTADAGDAPG